MAFFCGQIDSSRCPKLLHLKKSRKCIRLLSFGKVGAYAFVFLVGVVNGTAVLAETPLSIDSIAAGIASAESLMFESESLFFRYKRESTKNITPAAESGNQLLAEWTVANLGSNWYVQRRFLKPGKSNNITVPAESKVQVVREGLNLEWLQYNESATLNPVNSGLNVFQALRYTRGLSLNAPKYVIQSLGLEGKSAVIPKETRQYVDHPFLPEFLIRHKDKYQVLPEKEEIDDIACWVVEWKGMDRFWVDPSMGFAVVRRSYAWAPGEPLRFDTANSEYQEVKPGLWLPFKQVVDRYFDPYRFDEKLAGKVRYRDVYRLEEVKFDSLSDDFFDVSLPNGTRVFDAVRDFTYMVASESDDPFSLPIVEGIEHLRKSRNERVNWLLIANSLVVLVLAIIVLYRFLQKRRNE